MKGTKRDYHLVCVGTRESQDRVFRKDCTAENPEDLIMMNVMAVQYADYVLAVDLRSGETHLLKNRTGRSGKVLPAWMEPPR